MLTGVLTKMNKKLDAENRISDPQRLVSFLKSVGDKDLNANGVWWTSFGSQYEPIMCVNPAFGRARALERAASTEGTARCTCGGGGGAAGAKEAAVNHKYYESHDYNAGRHAPTTSTHVATCVQWQPPTTSHLHSWRRGFSASAVKS